MKGKPQSIDKVVKQSWENDVSLALTMLGAGASISIGAMPVLGEIGLGMFASGAAWNLATESGKEPAKYIIEKGKEAYNLITHYNPSDYHKRQ